jgi:hypothetical protein
MTGSMKAARRLHAAVLLNNGKVLAVGGAWDDCPPYFRQAIASTELYDPATGTWAETGPLVTGRWHPVITLLDDGRVLVTGGETGTLYGPTTLLDSAEIYDPTTGTWGSAGNMSVIRSQHRAVKLKDGRVLVLGGYDWHADHASAEIFRPETGVWATTASLNVGRQIPFATLLPDGRVLVGGGANRNLPPNYALSSTEIYDPATGTWTLGAELNQARYTGMANCTLLPDCRGVLVAGGFKDGYWNEQSAIKSAEIFGPLYITVTIDIKPGEEPNSINLGSNGKVPVAILSSSTFDARTVDPSSVTLAGAQVALKGKGDKYMAAVQDVNGDGLPDLIVHVDTTAFQLSAGDTEAVLAGKTYAGLCIRGTDTVRIVP